MTSGHSRRIAVVGAGLIGSALAGHLILAGNKVTIGARRPDAFAPPDYQRDDIDYPVATIEEAIDDAGVAILAIPNAAVAGFADRYRDQLVGAVIIDPSGAHRSRRSALPRPARTRQPTRHAKNPRQGTVQPLTPTNGPSWPGRRWRGQVLAPQPGAERESAGRTKCLEKAS
jgi:NADP oxidoreductase coenzyme F420-dependent